MTQFPTAPVSSPTDAAHSQAFEAGRRAGLATAAFALSLTAFFSLLGAEKAILAIALAELARRGSQSGTSTRRLANWATSIAAVFLISIVFVLICFWKELVGLVEHLRQLS